MERIDKVLCDKFDISSRTKAKWLVESGFVLVDGKKINKVSTKVDYNSNIDILQHKSYVSRGAYKLLTAIESFDIDFNNKIVLDIGASTGGFTQVALENGAKKVYAVDIGKSELDKSLIENPKVVNMAGIDFRNIEKEKVEDSDIIVGDLSFISLTKILPKVKEIFGTNKEMIFLFKPQFECGKDVAKKYKGIIKNQEIHEKLLKNFIIFAKNNDFLIKNITFSSIKGGDGNIEYLIYFSNEANKNIDVCKIVCDAFEKLK